MRCACVGKAALISSQIHGAKILRGGHNGGEGGSGVAMYEIEVKWGNRRIVTAQRYSAFFSLHSALVAAGVEEPDTASLFPPKTWFRSLDPDLLEARLNQPRPAKKKL